MSSGFTSLCIHELKSSFIHEFMSSMRCVHDVIRVYKLKVQKFKNLIIQDVMTSRAVDQEFKISCVQGVMRLCVHEFIVHEFIVYEIISSWVNDCSWVVEFMR